MLRRAWLCWLQALVLCAAPLVASAQVAEPLREKPGSGEFTLHADEVSYDRNSDVYEALGHVRVEQADGRTLTTDWLVFNGTTRVGIASGNVHLRDASDSMDAEFMAVNLTTLVALATNATLDSPNPGFAVEGGSLQRTGTNTFRLEEATFTTCRCPGNAKPRPWELEIDDARVQIGGYAVGRNLRAKLLGVPVLWLPWIAFPAKTQRQTGFLLPSLALSGRNGLELETPLFVTLGERANLTLRPEYLSDRGFKGGADFEYVLGEESWGEAGGSILPGDDEVDDEDFETPFSDDRWAYWWRHEQPLAPGARFGLDVKGISDNQYPVDFKDLGRDVKSARSLESSGFASFANAGFYAGIESSLYDDLQSPNDLDRDDFLLQRLPDVRFARLAQPIVGSPLRFGFDSRYTYFHQIDGRTDIGGTRAVNGQFFDTGLDALFDFQEPAGDGSTPGGDVNRDNFGGLGSDQSEGDGFYQEGELLANRGHRLDLYPNLSLPQRLGIFETLSEVGYRETLYFPDLGDAERREMWTGRLDVRTRLARSLSFRSLPLRHVVEPRVTFVAVSTPSQVRNPLFLPASGIRPQRLIDGDARLLTRNPADRVADERIMQLQLGNRFFGPSRAGGSSPSQLGEFRMGTGYDFIDGTATRIFSNGTVQAREDLTLAFDAGWDPDQDRVDEISTSVLWDAEAGYMLGLGYRYLRTRVATFENYARRDDTFDEFDDNDTVSQVSLDSSFRVSRRLRLFANGFVALNQSSSSAGLVGFQLGSDCRCWDLVAAIEHSTRPADTRFSLEVQLTGLGRGGTRTTARR